MPSLLTRFVVRDAHAQGALNVRGFQRNHLIGGAGYLLADCVVDVVSARDSTNDSADRYLPRTRWAVCSRGSTSPKVFLRTLLYASSQRGQIVESMYVRLRRAETGQTFSIWVYGEDSLARGSGLFVDRSGVVCNHHFLLHEDGTTFQFLPGDYDLEIYASLVGDDHAVKLFSTRLTISDQDAERLRSPDVGIYFDWRPESRSYHRHVRSNSRAQMPSAFQTILRDLTPDS